MYVKDCRKVKDMTTEKEKINKGYRGDEVGKDGYGA